MTASLRHLFRADPSTLDRYGVRCLHCGARMHTLSHIGGFDDLKYDWRFKGHFDAQAGRWWLL